LREEHGHARFVRTFISLRQARVTKVGVVFVILTAVATKEGFKIIDRVRVSFVSENDMVNVEQSVSAVAPQALAVSVAFKNLAPNTVRNRTVVDHSMLPDSHPPLHDILVSRMRPIYCGS